MQLKWVEQETLDDSGDVCFETHIPHLGVYQIYKPKEGVVELGFMPWGDDMEYGVQTDGQEYHTIDDAKEFIKKTYWQTN